MTTPPHNASQDGKSVEERMREKAKDVFDNWNVFKESYGILNQRIESALLEAFNEGREMGINESAKELSSEYPDAGEEVSQFIERITNNILSLLPTKEKPGGEKR